MCSSVAPWLLQLSLGAFSHLRVQTKDHICVALYTLDLVHFAFTLQVCESTKELYTYIYIYMSCRHLLVDGCASDLGVLSAQFSSSLSHPLRKLTFFQLTLYKVYGPIDIQHALSSPDVRPWRISPRCFLFSGSDARTF